MHDVGIAFHDELFSRFHGADFADFASVISPQIKQHQMFGEFFFVGHQVQLKGFVLGGGRPAGPRACDGADCDLFAENPHKDFGAGTDDLKTAKVEEEHKRRRIGATQAAVKREGGFPKLLGPALRGHNLEDVACTDVVFRLVNSCQIVLVRKVGDRRGDFERI